MKNGSLIHQKQQDWLRYWGKAKVNQLGESDHPLVFHSLDVAACACVYLEKNPYLLEQLAAWLDCEPATVKQVLLFLMAVHDVGKFAENFQNRVPEVVLQRFGHALPASNSAMCHDEIGLCFFVWLCEEQLLPENMRTQPGFSADAWLALLHASFGHHGRPAPPVPLGYGAALGRVRTSMYENSRNDAREFFDWCAEYFLPKCLPKFKEKNAKLASWWVAGLAVLADWIGSNTMWFPYASAQERKMSLENYWQQCALPRACSAIHQAGVLNIAIKPYQNPESLFIHLKNTRPAQEQADQIGISKEPQIFFLEDATGSGKTEAALILAARLINAGLADGLFFGLPTQATADQMFERVDLNFPAWFDEPGKANIVLAHGGRHQVHAFMAKLEQHRDGVSGELDTASLRVTQWLAQSNKRALQAQIGVGTLDQVLMASLRVKHQSLRVLGLFRKVLLIDEVHSYDPYMTQALCETLKLHASAGGSAILLSATMSLSLRSRLLDAYAQGAALQQPALESTLIASRRGRRNTRTQVSARSLEYPLLTRWSASLGAHPQECHFNAAKHSHRKLKIDYLSCEEQVFQCIEKWLKAGQTIVWIRNTVTDASQTWTKLQSRFGRERAVLFHSRFASIDRRRIQGDVLDSLGKHSNAQTRKSRVIVTTQVFQESLDADADQMICDLSFVDVMLQRLGRYRRHLRDAQGNRLPEYATGDDGRVPGAIVIFGPGRTQEPDAHWYQNFSRGAARVYQAHGKLYLSARAMSTGVILPQQFRTLTESVFGESTEPIPKALLNAEDRDMGQTVAQQWVAQMNGIELAKGYQGEGWSGDERIGTRLGDSIEAILLRAEGNIVQPWAQGQCDEHEDIWALSSIRIPGWWLGNDGQAVCTDDRLAARVEEIRNQHPALKHRLLLPFTASGGESQLWGCVLAKNGRSPIQLYYDAVQGLRRRP